MQVEPRWLLLLGWTVWATQGRFMSLLLAELGLDETQMGAVFALPTFINMAAPILWGLLADKVLEWKTVLTLSAGGGALLFALLGVPALQTFSGVLVVRTMHAVCISGVLPVMDAAALRLVDADARNAHNAGRTSAAQASASCTDARRARYGRARMFGTVGWGLMHLTLGILFQWFPYMIMVPASGLATTVFLGYIWLADSPPLEYEVVSKQEPASGVEMVGTMAATPCAATTGRTAAVALDRADEECSPAVVAMAAVESVLPAPPPVHAMREFARTCTQWFNLCFLATIVVIAVGQVQVESLVFLFFRNDLQASNLLLGFSVVVTVSFEIPLFALGAPLLKKLGPSNLMIVGLLAYASRVIVYTLVTKDSGWLILAVEPLHGVTYTCTQLASVFFISEIAPAKFENFAQGFLLAIKSFGFGVGVLLGAWAMGTVGSHALYRIAGAVVFANAALFGFAIWVHGRPRATRLKRTGSEIERGEAAELQEDGALRPM